VVAENHTVIGGLGEAVAGLLLRSGVAPKFRHIGLPDEFLLAGALPTLHDRYGISAEAMSTTIKGWLGKAGDAPVGATSMAMAAAPTGTFEAVRSAPGAPGDTLFQVGADPRIVFDFLPAPRRPKGRQRLSQDTLERHFHFENGRSVQKNSSFKYAFTLKEEELTK
jgi:hypothetical protein